MFDGMSSVIWAGQEYGRWAVVRFSHMGGSKQYWLCRCRCGVEKPVYSASLRNGRSKSCGCLKGERLSQRQTKHGGHRTLTYASWEGMFVRCYNPKHPDFGRYGGRGIVVCGRWRESFASFREDMGERPSKGHSIDRHPDNDGNYSCGKCPMCLENGWPTNARWATASQQNRNKDNNHIVVHGGEGLTIAEWAERTGLSFDPIRARPRLGWGVEDALTLGLGVVRAGRLIAFGGERLTMAEWSRRTGIGKSTLSLRFKAGWSAERALTTRVNR